MKTFYKQKILWAFWLMLLPLIGVMGQEPFITVWKPDNPSAYISGHTLSSNQQIWFPGIGTNYTIEWEEIDAETSHNGTKTDITTAEGDPVLIDFGSPQAGGLYRVKVLPDGFEAIRFFGGNDWDLMHGDHKKIIDITQWGDVAWNSMSYAFARCWNLTMTATDAPNLSGVTDMSYMFWEATAFNQPLGNWNVNSVTNMEGMFINAYAFNQPLNSWNVGNVTNMVNMFYQAYLFNQPLDNWNVSNVTNMEGMFAEAYAFNQSLNNWNVGNVTDMSGMFYNAIAFNQELNGWNISNVTNMRGMFYRATAFNQPLSSWNVSSVTNMEGMFAYATAFNQEVNSWNVSNVTNMDGMFHQATAFNQPLGSWNVSSVTTMDGMFLYASAFNQPLNSWDVSNVTDMYYMFSHATAFNQPLDNWNVNNVTDMDGMFYKATAFNQPLSSWNVGNVNYMDDMLSYCGMSCQNYDTTLIGWAALPTLQSGVTLGVGNLHYTSQEAVAARNSLIQLHGWYIDGDSHDADCYTAIFEHDDNSYQLFPNPANNFVKITGEDIERIDLYNIVGQLIHSEKISKNHASTIQLSTECYEIGSYLLHIINQEGKTVVKRLVIAR